MVIAFMDSHGNIYVPCDASAPGAEAFGPVGHSRPATAEEATLYNDALEAWTFDPEQEHWDLLFAEDFHRWEEMQ